MRTTVEITAEQHRALSAIAQRRGLRVFSTLVQEALDNLNYDLSLATRNRKHCERVDGLCLCEVD